jgi:hypothetical protein
MFTYRNIAIATVVLLVLIVGYYVLKPSKKVDVSPQKPVTTQQVAPAKKPAEPAKK